MVKVHLSFLSNSSVSPGFQAHDAGVEFIGDTDAAVGAEAHFSAVEGGGLHRAAAIHFHDQAAFAVAQVGFHWRAVRIQRGANHQVAAVERDAEVVSDEEERNLAGGPGDEAEPVLLRL